MRQMDIAMIAQAIHDFDPNVPDAVDFSASSYERRRLAEHIATRIGRITPMFDAEAFIAACERTHE
jgi:hypothetical protein